MANESENEWDTESVALNGSDVVKIADLETSYVSGLTKESAWLRREIGNVNYTTNF